MSTNLKRPNKKLENFIQQSIKGKLCPVHNKEATLTMDDEKEPVQVVACCPFFKKDVEVIGERLRKEYIFKAQKTLERLERERIKKKYGSE